MRKLYTIFFFGAILLTSANAQQFEKIPLEEVFKTDKKIVFKEIITLSTGDMLMIGSKGFAEIRDHQFNFQYPTGFLQDNKGNPQTSWPSSNIFKDAYYLHTGFKAIAEGPNKIVYLVSDNNNLGWIDYKLGLGFSMPPFNLSNNINIDKIWIDKDGDLFAAAADSLYIIRKATDVLDPESKGGLNYKSKLDKDSNSIVIAGAKQIDRFSLEKATKVYCFTADSSNNIYIGTNHGILKFEKTTGIFFNIFRSVKEDAVSVTAIDCKSLFSIWFSTLEKGMGSLSDLTHTVHFYPYKKDQTVKNPILNISRISDKELLIAPEDSLPAIFNTEYGSYEFIDDTSFHFKRGTNDIKLGSGNITALIKNGELYISSSFLKNRVPQKNYPSGPFIKEIMVLGATYEKKKNYYGRLDSLKTIHLNYNENQIDFVYAMRGFSSSDTITFAWKLEGWDNHWKEVPFSMLDERIDMASFENLGPGKYIFFVKAKKGSGPWLKNEVALIIIIAPPFWQTWWFWTSGILVISLLIFLIVRWRVQVVRKHEREKAVHEKELLEMEARALRAQMNPHFIFNCMNSIKALIQQHEEQKSVTYLTTFSKLIRTLFQNSDKRQISLYDEIETCKLYTQLEAMRFDGKLEYNFDIDSNLDLKSVMVPALIIQPFIENAIWHGIVPKEQGRINVSVKGINEAIVCEIDDDGIGREMSKLNKPITQVIHESKGVRLSQARMDIERMLNETQANIDIIDKFENTESTGTKVVITFNLN